MSLAVNRRTGLPCWEGVKAAVDPSTPATGRFAQTQSVENRPHHPQSIHGMVTNGSG